MLTLHYAEDCRIAHLYDWPFILTEGQKQLHFEKKSDNHAGHEHQLYNHRDPEEPIKYN